MRLKPLGIYSQRNPQWASELLGYNKATYTIGGWGCLITAFGCYIGKNPHDVNELLKAGGGYVSGGGLFIWSKSTLMGLNQTYASPIYDGPVTTQGINKIKQTLDNGYPLICEVDFDKNTVQTEMHWVLLIGYENEEDIICVDPWTGQIVNLEVYGGARRAIIQFKAYDKTLQKDGQIDLQKELDTCRADRDSHWNDRTKIADKLGVENNMDVIIAEIDKFLSLEDKFLQSEREKEKYREQVSQVTEQNKILSEGIQRAEKAIVDLEDDYKMKLSAVKDDVEVLKSINRTLQTKLDQLQNVKPLKEYSFWEWLNARWG